MKLKRMWIAAALAVAALPGVAAPQAPVKVLPAAPALDRAGALALAKKYYARGSSQMEPDLRPQFGRIVDWPVMFDGIGANPSRASEFTGVVAVLVNSTNARNFYVACASAGFALDPANTVAVGNLGSAILSYGEDGVGTATGARADELLKPYRDDAAALLLYGLTLPRAAGAAGIPLLIALANVYVDLGEFPNARVRLDSALKLDPRSWPAHEALAAYYIATGQKALAEKELRKREVWPASFRRKVELQETTEEKKAPTVAPEDSEGDLMTKIATLHNVPPVSVADFLQDISPSESTKMRNVIKVVEAQMKYVAPDLKPLFQYSSLQAFSTPQARADFETWSERWPRANAMPLVVKQLGNQIDYLKKAGITISGVDLDKLAKDPDYYSREGAPEVKIAGLDEFIGRMDKMGKELESAGSLDEQMKIAKGVAQTTETAPSVMMLRSGDYVNPQDVIVQQVNVTLLIKKRMAYRAYLDKVVKRLRPQVDQMLAQTQKDVDLLKKARENELKRAHDFSMQTKETDEKALLRRHAIHEKYDHQLNEITTLGWRQRTELVNATYLRLLKPNIEAMYADCMRHVMMISDPNVRKAEESVVLASVLSWVDQSLMEVVKGYAGEYLDPWDCDCDIEALAAARETVSRQYKAALAEARRKEKIGRDNFYKGIIPETSQLFQQLDKYTASLDFIFVSIKVGILKSELKYKIPVKKTLGKNASAGAEIALTFTQDHMRDTTGVALGLESSAKVGTENDALSATAKVWTNVGITVDDNTMIVKDCDWVAGASLTGSAGTGKTATGMDSIEGTLAYETSVMHGSKVTAEVVGVMSNDGKSLAALQPDELKFTGAKFGKIQVKQKFWKGEYK